MRQTRHDEDLRAAIMEELRWSAAVNAAQITVSVEAGNVTLSGEVGTHAEKALAVEAVYRVPRITSVTDRLLVRSARPATLPGRSETRERIRRALVRHARFDADTISVETTGTQITLTGTVRSCAESNQACHAAWAVPGVTKVDNRLRLV